MFMVNGKESTAENRKEGWFNVDAKPQMEIAGEENPIAATIPGYFLQRRVVRGNRRDEG